MIEPVTFLLAIAGHAGLMFGAVAAGYGRFLRLNYLTAAVIVTHVLLIWSMRYNWQFSEATRNGYTGFVLFHAALAAILAAMVTPFRAARVLLIASFATVSAGAIGAVFRYDVARPYRLPVIAIAVAGGVALVRARIQMRANARAQAYTMGRSSGGA